jgi:CheY-like chemotaxis protein
MHGGAIGFASNAGSGSTFSFYIKARQSSTGMQQTESNNPVGHNVRDQTSFFFHNTSTGVENPTDFALARRPGEGRKAPDVIHVLIVEDNLVNQRVLAKQLRNLGIKVAVANHGGEALDYLQTTKFCVDNGNELCLILMDWEMPLMDGLTAVRKIRELQKSGIVKGHVPVIAVTANVRSEQVQVAIEAGMDDVVSKPFRIPELYERMQNLLCSMEN